MTIWVVERNVGSPVKSDHHLRGMIFTHYISDSGHYIEVETLYVAARHVHRFRRAAGYLQRLTAVAGEHRVIVAPDEQRRHRFRIERIAHKHGHPHDPFGCQRIADGHYLPGETGLERRSAFEFGGGKGDADGAGRPVGGY